VPTNRGLRRRLWQPPAETLEALGSVLGAHWRAAATTRATRLFGSTRASWLRGQTALGRVVAGLTTSPRGAGSSDTRQDLRRY